MEQWTKSLPEDTVEYFIYAFPEKTRQGSAAASAIQQTLKDVKKAANVLVEQHLRGYLWQKDPFKLETRLKKTSASSASDNKTAKKSVDHGPGSFKDAEAMGDAAFSHLYGNSNFGDSIEDEWLIVWLLRSLSSAFPQIWICVTDSMGEFLLVEAANVLPGWLDPDIAEHRVWINKGQLRLIPVVKPRETSSASLNTVPGALSIDDVRQYIFDEKPTIHPTLVEQEAFHRLRVYPEQIQRNQHHALISMPRKLAFLLHEQPAYINAAIDAFYLRDSTVTKPLVAADDSKLVFPPTDFVTLRTRFTRVGYAQIKAQRFETPLAWQKSPERGYEDARLIERAQTGMKLCAGFEMLLHDPQRQDDRTVREIRMVLEDVESGEVSLPADEEIRSWGVEGDSESWMNIDFQDFEEELAGRGSNKNGNDSGGGFGDKVAQENLRKIVERFKNFLDDDTVDAYDDDDDGEEDDDEDDGDSDDTDDEDDEAGDASAPFTEDDFTKMMREMMGMPEDVMREIMTGKMDEAELKRFAESAQIPEHKTQNKEVVAVKGHEEEGEEGEDDEDIRELTAAMEAELRSSGALDISDSKQSKAFARIKGKAAASTGDRADEEQEVESGDELLDEDYNLVANMLESFKGQSGLPGPGGNLMGMLGLKMPRDEGDSGEDEDEDKPKSSVASSSPANKR